MAEESRKILNIRKNTPCNFRKNTLNTRKSTQAKSLYPTMMPGRFGGFDIVNINRHQQTKKITFGHCPNHLTPPLANSGNLVLFFFRRQKLRFASMTEKILMMMIMMTKRKIIVDFE